MAYHTLYNWRCGRGGSDSSGHLMFGAVGALPNCMGAAEVFARLGLVAEVLTQHTEVGKRKGHFRVVAAIQFVLVDRERARQHVPAEVRVVA